MGTLTHPRDTGRALTLQPRSPLSQKETRGSWGPSTRPSDGLPNLCPRTSSPMLQTRSHLSCPPSPRPRPRSRADVGPRSTSPTSAGLSGCPSEGVGITVRSHLQFMSSGTRTRSWPRRPAGRGHGVIAKKPDHALSVFRQHPSEQSPADPARRSAPPLATPAPRGLRNPVLPFLQPAGLSHPLRIPHNPFLPDDWFAGSLSAHQRATSSRAVPTAVPGQPAALPQSWPRRRPTAVRQPGRGGTGSGQVGQEQAPGQRFSRGGRPAQSCSGAATPVSSVAFFWLGSLHWV